MGKELRRNRGAAGEILRARDRRDQGADIGDDAKFSLVKKRLQFDQVRMEAEIATIAVLQGEGKKRRLRNPENATRRGIGVITARITRDDDVVGIVATKQEEADERLVVAALGMVAALRRRRSKMVLSRPEVLSAAQAAWRIKVRRVGAYITICPRRTRAN